MYQGGPAARDRWPSASVGLWPWALAIARPGRIHRTGDVSNLAHWHATRVQHSAVFLGADCRARGHSLGIRACEDDRRE